MILLAESYGPLGLLVISPEIWIQCASKSSWSVQNSGTISRLISCIFSGSRIWQLSSSVFLNYPWALPVWPLEVFC